jgi:hypothetical protein
MLKRSVVHIINPTIIRRRCDGSDRRPASTHARIQPFIRDDWNEGRMTLAVQLTLTGTLTLTLTG